MTVETPVSAAAVAGSAAAAEESQTGYVRKTVDGFSNLTISTYSSVKDMSPYAKSIAEAAEGRFGWVTGPLSKYLEASEPVIDSLDGRVDEIITAASSLKTKAAKNLDTVKSTAAEKSKQAYELRQQISTKTLDRLSESFEQVKEFSATRGKDMIHVDLIAYAEEVLDNANNVAKPTYLAIQKQLAVAIENVNKSVNQLQEAVVERVNRAELQEKMEIAVERIRELAQFGTSYINSNVELLRVFAKEQQTLIHSNLDKSIAYILSAPDLLHPYNQIVYEKSGVDLENYASSLYSRAEDLISEANTLLISITRVIRGVAEGEKISEPSEEKSEPAEPIVEEM